MNPASPNATRVHPAPPPAVVGMVRRLRARPGRRARSPPGRPAPAGGRARPRARPGPWLAVVAVGVLGVAVVAAALPRPAVRRRPLRHVLAPPAGRPRRWGGVVGEPGRAAAPAPGSGACSANPTSGFEYLFSHTGVRIRVWVPGLDPARAGRTGHPGRLARRAHPHPPRHHIDTPRPPTAPPRHCRRPARGDARRPSPAGRAGTGVVGGRLRLARRRGAPDPHRLRRRPDSAP